MPLRNLPTQRVTDQYDDLPNSWTFGVYRSRGTLQFRSYQRADVGMAGIVLGGGVRRDSLPRLDQGEVIIDPARFVADPDKARRFPELPYVTLRLAYMACDYFNADLGLAIVRAEHQAFYRRVFLHETIAEPRLLPGPAEAGRADGGGFPGATREGFRALSDDALDRL